MTKLLKNYWYVCAWDHEVTRAPLQRWIAGEPIVFWRREDGTAAALADRCPHRDAPLSLGRVVGDNLRCGYHGLEFDGAGDCVKVPGVEKTPAGLCTRAYPLVEKWGWLFIWPGDPALADEAELPDYHWLDDPEWTGKGGTLHVKCHNGLLRDNLLDLSHAHYVHQRTLATDAVVDIPVETTFDGEKVTVVRDMQDVETSPLFKRIGGFDGQVDHRQQIEFTPGCNIVIKVRVGGRSSNKVVEARVLNALTPETENTTHYFWSLQRNHDLDDDALTDFMWKANHNTFLEDVTIIEPQQEMIDRAPPPARPIRWHIDKGVDQAQRWVAKLLREEAGA